MRWALAASLCWSAMAGAAVTVHTWRDAQGVRHFADKPPAEPGTTDAAEITLDTGAALDPSDLDYYSIAQQWQRLRAERDAQNALELEKRRIDAGSDNTPAPVAAQLPHSVFYPSFYGLPGRPGPLPSPAGGERGPSSPRNAYVNAPVPPWPGR